MRPFQAGSGKHTPSTRMPSFVVAHPPAQFFVTIAEAKGPEAAKLLRDFRSCIH
jgi:hypothetical protein